MRSFVANEIFRVVRVFRGLKKIKKPGQGILNKGAKGRNFLTAKYAKHAKSTERNAIEPQKRGRKARSLVFPSSRRLIAPSVSVVIRAIRGKSVLGVSSFLIVISDLSRGVLFRSIPQ